MIVDFTNPASIAAWYAVHPAKHGPQLKALARLFPQWRIVRGIAKRAGWCMVIKKTCSDLSLSFHPKFNFVS